MPASIPTFCVVFGATGDLMAKKIVPALFQLHEQRSLPSGFRLVGFARRDLGDAGFRERVRELVRGYAPDAPEADVESFVALSSYVRGEFADPVGYEALRDVLRAAGPSNALLYMAVPPESYPPILNGLKAAALAAPAAGAWTRVVVEKPVGHDGPSGRDLDRLLASCFAEEQIYRIDHYLAKNAIADILDFRFKDASREATWNRERIAGIHVHLLETLGVEKRGAFYDRLGTFRDVGQNHLLEMLAYVTMEKPEAFDEHHVRARRVELLRQLAPPAPADTFRAQYDGYRAIAGVAPVSDTETYFHVRTFLTSPRWKGVPLTLESGKRMARDQKDIVVAFKDGTSKTFDFMSRAKYVEEYENLLLDCLAGDQTRFLSAEEVDALWAWTDPTVRAWQTGAVPLATYEPGTDQAREASSFIEE